MEEQKQKQKEFILEHIRPYLDSMNKGYDEDIKKCICSSISLLSKGDKQVELEIFEKIGFTQ